MSWLLVLLLLLLLLLLVKTRKIYAVEGGLVVMMFAVCIKALLRLY
jgi:hypothetical protein